MRITSMPIWNEGMSGCFTQYDVAITDFNSAHQLDAENMEVLFNRGLCFAKHWKILEQQKRFQGSGSCPS